MDHLIQEVKEAPIVFSVSEADQHFTVQTQTQKIEFRNNRFFLNNQIVNGLADTGASTVEKNNDLQSYFSFFFSASQIIFLVGVVTLTLIILIILFMIGRKNYRSKYINKEEDK